MDPKYVLTTPPTVEEWTNKKLRDNFQCGLEVLLQILAAMQVRTYVVKIRGLKNDPAKVNSDLQRDGLRVEKCLLSF